MITREEILRVLEPIVEHWQKVLDGRGFDMDPAELEPIAALHARLSADAQGGIVLFAGLLPVCRHCGKPETNCDCDVPFEPLREGNYERANQAEARSTDAGAGTTRASRKETARDAQASVAQKESRLSAEPTPAPAVATWPCYADCPVCGWTHDTEGHANGEPIYCEGCHKPFTAADLPATPQPTQPSGEQFTEKLVSDCTKATMEWSGPMFKRCSWCGGEGARWVTDVSGDKHYQNCPRCNQPPKSAESAEPHPDTVLLDKMERKLHYKEESMQGNDEIAALRARCEQLTAALREIEWYGAVKPGQWSANQARAALAPTPAVAEPSVEESSESYEASAALQRERAR